MEAEIRHYGEPASADKNILVHVGMKAAVAQVPGVGFGWAEGKLNEGGSTVGVLIMS